jgi:hypothetical protein
MTEPVTFNRFQRDIDHAEQEEFAKGQFPSKLPSGVKGRWRLDGEWEMGRLKRLEIVVDLDGRTWVSQNGAPPFEVKRGHKITAEFGR